MRDTVCCSKLAKASKLSEGDSVLAEYACPLTHVVSEQRRQRAVQALARAQLHKEAVSTCRRDGDNTTFCVHGLI